MNPLQASYYRSPEDFSALLGEVNLWEKIALNERESQLLRDSVTSINFIQVLIQNKIEFPKAWENYKILVCKDASSTLQGAAVVSEKIFLHILVSHPARLLEREFRGSAEPKGVGSTLIFSLLKQALQENCTLIFLAKSSSLPFYKKIFGSSVVEWDYNRIPPIRSWIAAAALRNKLENS